jgi:hypothetical protein
MQCPDRSVDLAPGYKRYATYFESWFKFFDDPETQKGLDDALSWLRESPAAQKIDVGRTHCRSSSS